MATSTDTFALPEGADRIQAQRAEYVDRLVFKGKTDEFERKNERLGSAEALFVGEAFDEIARAIDESALNDAEKLYLWEQLRAFPPVYRIADVGRINPQTRYLEVTSRQVEIQLNPALRAALKKDTALLSKILSADSRAQIMSAEIYNASSRLSDRAGEMVLIHALLSNGAGVNGEPIDFTKDLIVITSKVDDSAFALEEKTALATAAAASESRKQAVEEAREALQVALRELKTAAMAHAKEALDAFNGAKGNDTAMKTARNKKTAAEQAVRSIEFHVEQLLLVVQGDRERMKWRKDGRDVNSAWDKPDVATSDGFNTASKERLSSLEAIQDIPEVAPTVAAIRQFGEILSRKDHALEEELSAYSQLQKRLKSLRRAVYLDAIKNGIKADSLVLQAVQLLREIDHVRLGTSAKEDYAQNQVFHLEPAKDGRYDFSMADFGHIDAEGNLQCEGVATDVAADLRRRLASHLNDYAPDADRAPLAVDEVVHAARKSIRGAREEADKARTEFHSLRSDYSDLGSAALDMAAQEYRLRTDLSDVRAELSRVSEAAAQAAKSHEVQIASHQAEERKLRSEKADEARRAGEAEATIQSILTAVETLRAELDAANSKLFGAAGARQKAWADFDQKTREPKKTD